MRRHAGQDSPDTLTSYHELHRSRSPVEVKGNILNVKNENSPILHMFITRRLFYSWVFIHKCLREKVWQWIVLPHVFHIFLLRFLWKDPGKSPNPIMLVGRSPPKSHIKMADVPLLGLCTNLSITPTPTPPVISNYGRHNITKNLLPKSAGKKTWSANYHNHIPSLKLM